MRTRLALSVSIVVALVAGVTATVPAFAVEVEANGSSWGPAVSADGRWVAFVSEASNLVEGETDANELADVFLVDTSTGTIRAVSSSAVQADGPSDDVDVSADGRFVVFESEATNLISLDENQGASDIFMYDAQTGGITLVSRRGATGVQGNATSVAPTISSDGTRVAFVSQASNLTGNDTNGRWDVFVRDLVTGTTTRVSTDSTGRQANNTSDDAAIASTGTHVAFSSIATNLIPGDTNGARDVFLKNLSTGKTIRVSVTNGERQARSGSTLEDVSANGRYTVFNSSAANLVKNDVNNRGDVFARDRVDGITTLVSRDGATLGNGNSFGASISDDGSTVVFQTSATNLGPDGNGTLTDIYERKLGSSGLVPRVTDAGGGWPEAESFDAALGANGLVAAFASTANDLVAGDTGWDDVFVHRWSDATRTSSTTVRWSRALPAG